MFSLFFPFKPFEYHCQELISHVLCSTTVKIMKMHHSKIMKMHHSILCQTSSPVR